VIDRNPQKYVENIFQATEADFQAAQQRVYRTPQRPSHVTLPVLRAAGRKDQGAAAAERKTVRPLPGFRFAPAGGLAGTGPAGAK
jgi:hypothetical protein